MGWYIGVYPNGRTVVFQSFTTPTKGAYPELELIMGPFKSMDNAEDARTMAVEILQKRKRNPRRRNPGAKWHAFEAEHAEKAERDAGSFGDRMFFKGYGRAHRASEGEARRLGMNPRRRYSNPAPKGTVIYDNIEAIQAEKGPNSLWPREKFEHRFKRGSKVIGLPNGDLLIKSTKGKRLWKNFDYD